MHLFKVCKQTFCQKFHILIFRLTVCFNPNRYQVSAQFDFIFRVSCTTQLCETMDFWSRNDIWFDHFSQNIYSKPRPEYVLTVLDLLVDYMLDLFVGCARTWVRLCLTCVSTTLHLHFDFLDLIRYI